MDYGRGMSLHHQKDFGLLRVENVEEIVIDHHILPRALFIVSCFCTDGALAGQDSRTPLYHPLPLTEPTYFAKQKLALLFINVYHHSI
jgi:hypothetical protein